MKAVAAALLKTLALGLLLLLCSGLPALAASDGRAVQPLDAGWRFMRADVAHAEQSDHDDRAWATVSLPHTFNGVDGEAGGAYYRGPAWYRRELRLTNFAAGQRRFLQFDGATLVADVWVNGQHVGQHRGGYAVFRFDVSAQLHAGLNHIAVRVDNAPQPDVSPLGGDFTVFGGLTRGVSLITVAEPHFDLMDDGGPGISWATPGLSPEPSSAQTHLHVNARVQGAGLATMRLKLLDGKGRVLQTQQQALPKDGAPLRIVDAAMTLEQAHRWQGVRDPYLYRLRAELVRGHRVTDRVEVPVGIRHIAVDAQRGFLLNGQPYPLHGVNLFHSGRPGKGLAVSAAEMDEDAAILSEMGVNALRLVHFQHPQHMLDLADRHGWLVWTEIPLNSAMAETPEFRANLAQQLRELIKQNQQHPAVAVWGVGNEVYRSDAPVRELLGQLNEQSHQLDPTRPTVYAHCCAEDDDPMSRQTTLIGFNRYYGWYDGEFEDFGRWADRVHAQTPERPMAISEYGAGASALQQADPPTRPVTTSAWHPEQYQALFHESYWRQISQRPYLWGSFVWVAFDLASAGRHEGDRAGINDKGLVSYDRKTRKDAFYLYQAQWSTKPFVHITSRRYTPRPAGTVDVKVYSNAAQVTLQLDGVALPTQTVEQGIAVWRGVPLPAGRHSITARTDQGATDQVEWLAVPAQTKEKP